MLARRKNKKKIWKSERLFNNLEQFYDVVIKAEQ